MTLEELNEELAYNGTLNITTVMGPSPKTEVLLPSGPHFPTPEQGVEMSPTLYLRASGYAKAPELMRIYRETPDQYRKLIEMAKEEMREKGIPIREFSST